MFNRDLAIATHISNAYDGVGTYSTKQFVSGYIRHDALYEISFVDRVRVHLRCKEGRITHKQTERKGRQNLPSFSFGYTVLI